MRDGLEITKVYARKIYDCGGNPTVEAEIKLRNGARGRASAPSETGEADPMTERGEREKAVLEAVEFVNRRVSEALLFEDASDQWYVDQLLLEAGCEKNGRMGERGELLAVSMAVARAAGAGLGLPLFRYLGGASYGQLPVPAMTMLHGGGREDSSRPFMDFRGLLAVPRTAGSFAESVRMGTEVYHALKKLLLTAGYSGTVGKEGAFSPELRSAEEALQYLMDAMEISGYRPGTDFSVILDAGAEEFYDKENDLYVFHGESMHNGMRVWRSSREMTEYYRRLSDGFPLSAIEDGLQPLDWDGWRHLTDTLGHKVRILGGALFHTDRDLLEKGIREKAAGGAVINMAWAGTVTETLEFIEMAKAAGLQTVLSSLQGETEDAFLADLAAAAGVPQVKLGAPCRTEQTAKYNELLRIEEFLG